MISRRCVVPALIAVTVVACQAAAPSFTAADEATVRGEFDSTQAWLPAGKFEAWTNLWTEDATFQPAHLKGLSGRADMLAWAKALPPIEVLQFTNIKIVGDGNFAYGTTGYVLKLKDLPADTGKQLAVVRRQADGKWLVVSGAFNSDLPLPAPAAASAASKPAANAAGKKR